MYMEISKEQFEQVTTHKLFPALEEFRGSGDVRTYSAIVRKMGEVMEMDTSIISIATAIKYMGGWGE